MGQARASCSLVRRALNVRRRDFSEGYGTLPALAAATRRGTMGHNSVRANGSGADEK